MQHKAIAYEANSVAVKWPVLVVLALLLLSLVAMAMTKSQNQEATPTRHAAPVSHTEIRHIQTAAMTGWGATFQAAR